VSTESSEHKPAHDQVTIHINKDRFTVTSPILGSDLRALGQIPAENQLFLEQHGDEPDILIEPAKSYELKNGSHLYDLPRGTVGAELEEQLQAATSQLSAARIDEAEDGTRLLRWETHLPSEWTPAHVQLFITVPPAYPAQAPSGFDVVGTVVLSAGQAPAGSGPRDLGGVACQHFCWNPAGQIDYTESDGLWRFAKFSESRFLTVP
jgi:hypothetical protein